MSEERLIYSIQKTYIIKPASKSEKRLLTCDERIDISGNTLDVFTKGVGVE